MRFKKLESSGLIPLGQGEQKKVFVDPENENRVISEIKDGAEKDTLRQLEGKYYLTKIVHLLLPKNIPDIYQVGQSHDGVQTVDTERIMHSSGHALLQEARQSGGDEEIIKNQIIQELGNGMGELEMKLSDIGLGFNIDENVGNYTKDEKGDVYYLETFSPWRIDDIDEKEIEVLFDEELLREAIENISDEKVKKECAQYLENILELIAEEREEMQEKSSENIVDLGPQIKEIELILDPFLEAEMLAILHSVKTKEDALASTERAAARKALMDIFKKLKTLEKEIRVPSEQFINLNEKRGILARAVGTVNGAIVDHTRF